MKKYNDTVIKIACKELSIMLDGIRKVKNGKSSFKDIYTDSVTEIDYKTFLDYIENKYSDLLSNPNSFDNLLNSGAFNKQTLKPLISIGINSLDELANRTLDEYCALDIRPYSKVKFLKVLIDNNILFKEATIEDMKNLYEITKNFV